MRCQEERLVALVRYVERKGSAPRLYCLTPGVRCLFMNNLPFGDEMRAMEWAAPPKDGAPAVSDAQAAAADALVEALDFCNPASGGEPSEGKGRHAVRPKDTANPMTQRVYQLILHKALNEGGGLPAPHWRVMAPLQPDGALFGAARGALDAFAAACPTA